MMPDPSTADRDARIEGLSRIRAENMSGAALAQVLAVVAAEVDVRLQRAAVDGLGIEHADWLCPDHVLHGRANSADWCDDCGLSTRMVPVYRITQARS